MGNEWVQLSQGVIIVDLVCKTASLSWATESEKKAQDKWADIVLAEKTTINGVINMHLIFLSQNSVEEDGDWSNVSGHIDVSNNIN